MAVFSKHNSAQVDFGNMRKALATTAHSCRSRIDTVYLLRLSGLAASCFNMKACSTLQQVDASGAPNEETLKTAGCLRNAA